MEAFDDSKLKSLAYQTIIQQGLGGDIDRYIYQQQGEGLGSFFGSLFRQAVPFIGRAIKGVASVAKPHLISAGKEIINAGAKKGVEELANLSKRKPKTSKSNHKKHTAKKARWQSL